MVAELKLETDRAYHPHQLCDSVTHGGLLAP